MMRFILRRLALLFPTLFLIHFFGFLYAVLGRRYQASHNPFFAPPEGSLSIWSQYSTYLQGVARLDFGSIPGVRGLSLGEVVARATGASLGLLGIAFSLSVVAGLSLGLLAVRSRKGTLASWLVPFTTLSLAMPSFYAGALLISAVVFWLLYVGQPGTRLPLPLRGFGWDEHLVFPTLALMLRPAAQLARVSASLMVEEFGKQYVIAARSLGYDWNMVRWRVMLRNVMAPVILTVASSFRLVVAELILVEALFGWPGLGSLLFSTVIRPKVASIGSAGVLTPSMFLCPPLVAGILAIFATLILVVDFIASLLAWHYDPRVRSSTEGIENA